MNQPYGVEYAELSSTLDEKGQEVHFVSLVDSRGDVVLRVVSALQPSLYGALMTILLDLDGAGSVNNYGDVTVQFNLSEEDKQLLSKGVQDGEIYVIAHAHHCDSIRGDTLTEYSLTRDENGRVTGFTQCAG